MLGAIFIAGGLNVVLSMEVGARLPADVELPNYGYTLHGGDTERSRGLFLQAAGESEMSPISP